MSRALIMLKFILFAAAIAILAGSFNPSAKAHHECEFDPYRPWEGSWQTKRWGSDREDATDVNTETAAIIFGGIMELEQPRSFDAFGQYGTNSREVTGGVYGDENDSLDGTWRHQGKFDDGKEGWFIFRLVADDPCHFEGQWGDWDPSLTQVERTTANRIPKADWNGKKLPTPEQIGRRVQKCINVCPPGLSEEERKQCSTDPASGGFTLVRSCYWASDDSGSPLEGRYETYGDDGLGSTYSGETIIEAINDYSFEITQDIEGEQLTGFGQMDGRGNLSVKFREANICARYFPALDGIISGQWSSDCLEWFGSETLIRRN